MLSDQIQNEREQKAISPKEQMKASSTSDLSSPSTGPQSLVQRQGAVGPEVQHDLRVGEDAQRVDLVARVALLPVPHRLVVFAEGGGLVALLAPSGGDV